MAKKNQQQQRELGEGSRPAKLTSGASATVASDEQLETAAEAAQAQGGGEPPAVAGKIGPEDAPPAEAPTLPVVDPLEAAAARRKKSREDAAAELRLLAKGVAEGRALTDAENDRVVELCDTVQWTIGMFKAEVTIATNRLKTRRSVEDLPKARRALQEAKQEHAEAKAELERATTQLQREVTKWATRIAQAEAFIATAEDAEKQLLRSAPEPVRDALRRAKQAADGHIATLREAEQRLNHALKTLNDHKDARVSVGDGTEEGSRLDGLIVGATTAVQEAKAHLDTVRERKAEIDEEVAELQDLAMTA